METITTRVYFDIGAGYALNADVIQKPAPVWEYGLGGIGPNDLVANTGIATLYLDNSHSNSASTPGYYSPTHDDALAGFTEGIPVKITIQRTGGAETDKFIGTITALRPSSGLFEDPVMEVEAWDWMGYLSKQELGQQTLVSNKRADEALTTALVEFPIQPTATDFDVGTQTFLLMFNTDYPETTMASFFQKLARNEQGFIYMEGDGTLVFEKHNARAAVTASSFTVDGTMSEFDVAYERADIFNSIESHIRIAAIDAAATTVLWDLHEQGTPAIKPGETLTLICAYTDPETGQPISAVEVVDPSISYEFGSVGDYATDDMHADLSQDNTVGGNSILMELTNDHATQIGYLNDLQIKGKGIYVYDPMILTAVDQDSIDDRGKRKFVLILEHVVDPKTAQQYANIFKGGYSTPHFRMKRIKVLANQTQALADGLIAAEMSTRFTAIEAVTGVSYDFHINRLKYTQDGPQLWVEILAQPFGYHGTFIWDASHWDDPDDARWSV